MRSRIFSVKTVEIGDKISLDISFDKEMNVDENIECYFGIKVTMTADQQYELIKKFRYVYDDTIVSIEDIETFILDMLKEMITTLDALDRGINLSLDFYLEIPGIDNRSIEIEKELKKTITSINRHKLQPYVMDLYTSVLIHYKGTDTLQKRKYEKMIEAQEDAILYMRNQGDI